MAIGFPHTPFPYQFIHIISRPVYRPDLSFRSAPRVLVPLGSPVPRPVPRPVAHPGSRLVISSGHLIRSSHSPIAFYRHTVSGSSHSRRRNEDGGGAVFFSRAPFASAHYRSPRHQALIIVAASDYRGSDGGRSSSSHPALFSLARIAPRLIMETMGVGVRHL